MSNDKNLRKQPPRKPGLRKEFLMNRASVQSIWNEVSTSRGLSEWFAESVDITGDHLHVYWDFKGDEREATIVEKAPPYIIKWVWNDAPDSYLRLEIVETELSRTVSLLVEDQDLMMEEDTLSVLWDQHIDKLMASLGLA